MNKAIIIFLIIGLCSCGKRLKSEKKEENVKIEKPISELEGFELLHDFEENKSEFDADTFELLGHSAEGGELKVFNNKKFNYVVYDFWLFGETGKLNYTYWTDKNDKKKLKFVKQLKYQYDKPYYVEGYKTDSILIRYLSYSESKTKLFDISKTEILDPDEVEKVKSELETFFQEVTNEVKFKE